MAAAPAIGDDDRVRAVGRRGWGGAARSRSLATVVVVAAIGCAGGSSDGSADGSATSTAGSTTSEATSDATTTAATITVVTTTSVGTLETASTTDDATTEDSAGCVPTIDAIYKEVFVPRCSGSDCHDSVAPAGGLNLVSAGVEGRLVGVPSTTCDGWIRVSAGDPAASLLHAKLVGEAPCGAPMPLAGPPLSAATIACIDAWIDVAAPSCETCGGAVCLDLDVDPERCGACDVACPLEASCAQGECVCPGSQTACGAECVDLAADPAHCGGCEVTCPMGQVCAKGSCAADCGDLSECQGGCVDLDADPAHCGGCDITCLMGQMCVQGECTCGGLSECGGACVDTQTDPAHCGGCGLACAPGTLCMAGSCVCDGAAVSFKATVAPLLAEKCALPECHGPPNYEESLDLTATAAWADLVGVASVQCGAPPRVKPGDPAGSYLIDKLLGVDMCLGVMMPKQAPPLAGAELAVIGRWICQGALDN